MFPKSRTQRINQTLDFIAGYTGGALPHNIPATVRADIVTYIRALYPRTTAGERQIYDDLSDQMSVKAQIATGTATGTQPERHLRRAIVLIWSALGAPHSYPPAMTARIQQGMTLPPAQLPAALNEAMKCAAVQASQAGAAHIFNMEFSANPLAFIQTYRVFIHGSTAGQALLTNPAAASYQNVIPFTFYYNARLHRFEFCAPAVLIPNAPPPPFGAHHPFNVVSVPALHWSQVPGRGNDPLPAPPNNASFAGLLGIELTGASWMFTTQFTGCSFCCAGNGGQLYAAHVSPAGIGGLPIMNGNQLANQLMGTVATVTAPPHFANWPGGGVGAPAVSVFGNGAGNAVVHGGGNSFYPPKTQPPQAGQMKWMSLFGRVHNGNWEFYTQSIDGVDSILEARRIL